MQRSPEKQVSMKGRNGRGRLVAAAAAAVLLSGCGTGEEGARDAGAASSASAGESARTGTENTAKPPTDFNTPSAGESPTLATPVPGERMVGQVVCDGLFTQEVRDGQYLVIGRPVVDPTSHYPLGVETSPGGVQVMQETHTGPITWYDLEGKKQPIQDIHCERNEVYPRHITPNNDRDSLWVASDSPNSKEPEHWDLNALNPDGFGGIGLDYANMDNLMSASDIGEVVAQAQRDASRS